MAVFSAYSLFEFKGGREGESALPKFAQSLDVFWVDDPLTKPLASHLLEGETCVVESDAIGVHRRAIGIEHQDRLSNGIGRAAKFFFRIAHIFESLGERLMRPLEFDGEVRDTSGRLGQREVCIRGGAGLTRIDRERPENSVVIG